MKNDNEDGGFEAIEVSPNFFSSSSGGGLVKEDEDDIEQLPQQDDESTMNDESTIAAASSYISRGYSYVASNKKWVFVVMAATFVVFFSIGIGLGYPIGNSIYGNDDASSVSSAMAVALMGAKSGKSKSDKSSGTKAGKAIVPTQSPSSSPTGSPTGPLCPSVPSGAPVVYNESFVAGQTASVAVQQAWDCFLASLTGTYTQVTISGSLDSTGVTCSESSAVNQLANARNTNAAVSVQCNSRTWTAVDCGGGVFELSADGGCDCSSDYAVRPKINNPNWGGVGGTGSCSDDCNSDPICNVPDQSIRVEFS